jgi:hypothetical protein
MLMVEDTPERERVLSVKKDNNISEEEEEDYRSDFSCFSPIIQKHPDQTINNKTKTTTATTVLKPSTALVTRILYHDVHVATTNKEIPVTNNTATTTTEQLTTDDDNDNIKTSISNERTTKSTPNDT